MATKGKRIVIWGLTDSGEPTTDKQIEREIEKHRAAGAPANTQFDTIMWELSNSDRFATMPKGTCSVEPIALLESIGSYARLRPQTFRFALPFRFRSFRQS
jgi:hypothetical protein